MHFNVTKWTNRILLWKMLPVFMSNAESFDDVKEYLDTIESQEQGTSRFACALSAEDVSDL